MRKSLITPSEAKKLSEAFDYVSPYAKLLNDVIETAAHSGKTFATAVIKQEHANGLQNRLKAMGYQIAAGPTHEDDGGIVLTIDWTNASAYPSTSYLD